MKWRRISGATILLSRILKILKIPQSFQSFRHFFFFFKIFPLKIKIFKNPDNMLEGNGWWICVQNFKSISSKMAEIWHKTTVKNRHFSRHFGTLQWFSEFYFWPILMLQKVFSGHFSRSLRKSDLKACIAALNHEIFLLDLFYLVTWHDLDLYYGHEAQ